MSLAVLAILGAGGCGHGGGPTAPSEPFVQASIVANLAGATVAGSNQAPTLLEAKLFFDGVLVQDQTVTSPTATMSFSALGTLAPGNIAQACTAGDPGDPAATGNLGPHTLDLTIVQQTASPSGYIASGIQLHLKNGSFTETAPLSSQIAALATGQSFHWSFCL